MKDIGIKPDRQAYICPGCHRRINIDIETVRMRVWSKDLCNDEISCGEMFAMFIKNAGITVKALIEAKPQIYCDECSGYYDPIDWDIANLVHIMQRLGINTVGSCAGHGGELTYDGMCDILQMMKECGRPEFEDYVTAYVTYKDEDGAASRMKQALEEFSIYFNIESRRMTNGEEVFKFPIVLDDGSQCGIFFYNHKTSRYGGHEIVKKESDILGQDIPYAEISFTYFCSNITSMTEKSAQAQLVELIARFVDFVENGFGNYNNRKEHQSNE